MSNSINITKCDNQLILIAVNNDNTNETVEICNIVSGNTNTVNVTIEIEEGTSAETVRLNGLQQDLSGTHKIQIPKGNYSLVYSGINWGGPYNFQFSVNGGQPYQLLNKADKPLNGAIWSLGDLDTIKFDVKTPATV